MAHLAPISRRTAAALTRLGSGIWPARSHRTQDDALRVHVAHLGEELLSALAPLPARCEALRESVERLVGACPLSGVAQHNLAEELEGFLTRTRILERQVQETLRDLAALHSRELENRSERLGILDLEIWLLVEDIDEREALWVRGARVGTFDKAGVVDPRGMNRSHEV